MFNVLSPSLAVLIGLVGLLAVVSVLAEKYFFQQADQEIEELFKPAHAKKGEPVSMADLAELPDCVRKWLLRSGAVGKQKIHTVRLKQKGLMRTAPDKPWMPVEAEQYFNVDEPGFVWKAKVRMAPLLYLTGRDKYSSGKGNMLIKAMALIPIVKSSGKEIDQGTLLRYMAELQWFPTAALNDYLRWEELDAHRARATMNYKGVSASGVYTFNTEGDLVDFIANRYREEKGKFVMDDWGGTAVEFKEFHGVRIGSKVHVIWHYKSGDFNWYQCEITDIEYNQPVLY